MQRLWLRTEWNCQWTMCFTKSSVGWIVTWLRQFYSFFSWHSCRKKDQLVCVDQHRKAVCFIFHDPWLFTSHTAGNQWTRTSFQSCCQRLHQRCHSKHQLFAQLQAAHWQSWLLLDSRHHCPPHCSAQHRHDVHHQSPSRSVLFSCCFFLPLKTWNQNAHFVVAYRNCLQLSCITLPPNFPQPLKDVYMFFFWNLNKTKQHIWEIVRKTETLTDSIHP